MFEIVETKLTAIGYTVSEFDETIISYIIDDVVKSFLIDANIDELPDEVESILADQVVGKFLSTKKASGQLDIDGLDFDAIKSVTVGDTTVSYGASNSDIFDAYLKSMLSSGGKGLVACYRQLKW